jgi:hypothetical protein
LVLEAHHCCLVLFFFVGEVEQVLSLVVFVGLGWSQRDWVGSVEVVASEVAIW